VQPKRRLFVLGVPYVSKIRKTHESDEDIVRLCASHESLRVQEREAAISATLARNELAGTKLALARSERAAMISAIEIDERPCRRLHAGRGTCPCINRCWFLDATSRRRRGLPPTPIDTWIGFAHRVEQKDEGAE
jgi:hypothetical protein